MCVCACAHLCVVGTDGARCRAQGAKGLGKVQGSRGQRVRQGAGVEGPRGQARCRGRGAKGPGKVQGSRGQGVRQGAGGKGPRGQARCRGQGAKGSGKVQGFMPLGRCMRGQRHFTGCQPHLSGWSRPGTRWWRPAALQPSLLG